MVVERLAGHLLGITGHPVLLSFLMKLGRIWRGVDDEMVFADSARCRRQRHGEILAGSANRALSSVLLCILGGGGDAYISYQTTVKHEDTPIKVDILDTSHQDECQPSCHDVYDADAFVVVYSITDVNTFKVAQDELGRIRSGATANAPILLLGNKLDFDHVRQVSVKEAQSTAEASSCLLVEVSAAEGHTPIIEKLHGLFQDAIASLCHRGRSVKRRKSLFENVSKKLGSVFRMRSLEDSGSAAAEVHKQKMMQVCYQTSNRRSV
ncbi:Ras-related and estrogen-regulated growth inhibitor [Elysia marginata]|uniref:small monomeric GTPase n=1 Tax=Elysia marginata TaxID=1093978 RepID=A0AAV4IJP1_9GAST|nr:Ras-related and estrogen-regulated growth inhibitor [Elysia marginata]